MEYKVYPVGTWRQVPPNESRRMIVRLTDGQLVGHDRPERLPSLAVKTHHPELLDDAIVGRAGVDRKTGQQQIQPEILQVCRLPHDILARDVVAALPQHLYHQFGRAIAIGRQDTLTIAFWIVSVH